MDQDIPSIELKLQFPDLDSHILSFLYLLTILIISTLIYMYIHIFEKFKKILNRHEYINELI